MKAVYWEEVEMEVLMAGGSPYPNHRDNDEMGLKIRPALPEGVTDNVSVILRPLEKWAAKKFGGSVTDLVEAAEDGDPDARRLLRWTRKKLMEDYEKILLVIPPKKVEQLKADYPGAWIVESLEVWAPRGWKPEK